MGNGIPRPGFGLASILIALSVALPRDAVSQGLSGSSLDVSVVSSDSAPILGATVSLVDIATGATRRIRSTERGRALFENLTVGSYRLEARIVGLRPAVRDSITMHLGDRMRVQLVLARTEARQLEGVIVTSSLFSDPGAGGPASSVSRQQLRALPLINRDFVGLLGTSSHATGPGSLWVNGQHSRSNAIQIDGTIGNDLFGVSVTPGSGPGGKSISLEALEEIRILVSPFDVRQGGFAGGLINAVTRSGSNTARGAVFTSYSHARLTGPDTAGAGVTTFEQVQYGLSIGGPLVRDKLHYFFTGELQSRVNSFSGLSADDPSSPVSTDAALRVSSAIKKRFGFDPGGPEEPKLEQPNGNLFVKVSWNPSPNSQVEMSQSLMSARSDGLNRTLITSPNVDGWQLSNSSNIARGASSTSRIKAVSAFGAWSNEAILSASHSLTASDSRAEVPLFMIGAGANTYIAAGSTKAAQRTRTTYRTIELTNNVSLRRGDHVVTFGTQNLFLGVRDNFFLGQWGVWTFDDVQSLENGQPSRYEVAQPHTPGGPLADYSATLLSAYVQDMWRATPKLTITVGARADAPFLDSPRRNFTLASNEKLGRIDTGDFPSGDIAFAPRLGFAWELGSKGRTLVRGGAGIFTSRPPFVWLTGAFSSTGQEQSTLVCQSADGVPAPTTDIRNLPYACLTPTAPRAVSRVTFVDPDYRFQQAIKYSAGIDRQLGKSGVLSFDIIHAVSRHNTYVDDVNLTELGLSSEGRMMYGTVSSQGLARPTRIDSLGFGPIYRFGNISGDRSTSVSLSANRRWKSGALVHAGYTWSSTLDVMAMTGLIGEVILRSNPLDGTLSNRIRRRSTRDIPHTLFATAVVPAGRGVIASAYVRARSGTPYAFTVGGDANADGVVTNDLAFIPRNEGDISLADPTIYPTLAGFIESKPCLRDQRGRIVTRNSCRNPGVLALDGRIAKKVWTRNSRGVEISADLFNVPNMLNNDWGLVRETSSREDARFLPIVGWDAEKKRPRYTIARDVSGQPLFPQIDRVATESSRWRAQIGVRYDF